MNFRNERGSALVQVLMVLVVSIATNLTVMGLMSDQNKQHRGIYVKTSALAIRQNVVGVLSNYDSWVQTRTRQPFMTCRNGSSEQPYCWPLQIRTDSMNNRLPASQNQGGNFQPIPSEEEDGIVSPKPKLKAPTAKLNLYDAKGNLIHSNAPDAGYTATGEPCTGFTPDGNDACPLKFDVEWRAVCNAVSCSPTTFDAPEFVSINVQYAPKSKEFDTPFNPMNYGLTEQNRLLFATQASPSLECAMKNAIFIGPGKIIGGIVADQQGCVAYEAFFGPRGERGIQGNVGPAGPQGDRGPAAVCP